MKKTYICETCNYNGGLKKSNYLKHLRSNKHNQKINIKNDETQNGNGNTQNNNIFHENNQLKTQIQLLQNQLLQTQSENFQSLNTDYHIFKNNILLQNQNLMNDIQTLRGQIYVHQQFIHPQQQHSLNSLSRFIKNENNKPKLSEFLENNCKDVFDYDEFILYKNINYEEEIKTLESIHCINPVELTRKLLFQELKKHTLNRIPFRCIDIKRKLVICFRNGKWEHVKWLNGLFLKINTEIYNRAFDLYSKNYVPIKNDWNTDEKNTLQRQRANLDIDFNNIIAVNNMTLKDRDKTKILDELLKFVTIDNLKNMNIDIENIIENYDDNDNVTVAFGDTT